MWWMLALAWGAPCPEPQALGPLEVELEAAERKLGDLDSDGFLADTADLSARIGCLAEPVEPTRAAHLHRVFGLRAYLARQEEDAKAAFGSARDADPTYVFPFWLVPERHEIRELYAASEPDLTHFPVLPAKSGVLLFDGEESTDRPRFRPTLVQVLDDDGNVVRSAWIRPTDLMPEYDEAHPVLPPLAGGPKAVRTSLFVGSATAAVVSGVSYGLAGVANGRFNNAANNPELLASQRQANTFVTTSAIAGGAAVASLTGALLIGRF
jgi:hypothetical protein